MQPANPIPPFVILALGAVALIVVLARTPRLVPGSPAPARQAASRLVVGFAAVWLLLLIGLVVTCVVVGQNGSIGFSGSAYTVGGEPYYDTVTAEHFPSWSYAVSVLLGLGVLGTAMVATVRRGHAWLAAVVAHSSLGGALTVAAIAAAGPITELTLLSSHSATPPPWTAVGPALMAAAFIVLAITFAVSTIALVRRRPTVAN